ncbi:hypothetical protein QBC37DRAFT_381023 [Rhypophila decipiens]|uniref:Uncharacterized protein n=1 Tax=Rhypophila decipiens TaxID=261697 RepID=A0AAN6XVK2_9PEZI|nr:hypothetical protein QBC37DRAFT_381023 [Rhypophila decipiens]
MSTNNKNKRARADTIGNARVTTPARTKKEQSPEYADEALDASTQEDLLATSAKCHPDIVTLIESAYKDLVARQAKIALPFDTWPMKARYELRRYNELPKHEQYDKEGDAADLISKLVESVLRNSKTSRSELMPIRRSWCSLRPVSPAWIQNKRRRRL